MPEPASAYRPIAAELPAVYQADEESWEQVRGYLGLVDGLLLQLLAELDAIGVWLSPEARKVPVPGLPPGAAAEEVAERLFELTDELAAWFGFEFPESWRIPDDREWELERRFEFVRRAPRLWRRRGTPAGFLAWLCFWFDLGEGEAPLLREHFKYRPAGEDPGESPEQADEHAHRVSLLVPLGSVFSDYRRRRELLEFVAVNAPAHLLMRVCWVRAGDRDRLTKASHEETEKLLGVIASVTEEADGIHLEGGERERTPLDRLGLGTLPGPFEQ